MFGNEENIIGLFKISIKWMKTWVYIQGCLKKPECLPGHHGSVVHWLMQIIKEYDHRDLQKDGHGIWWWQCSSPPGFSQGREEDLSRRLGSQEVLAIRSIAIYQNFLARWHWPFDSSDSLALISSSCNLLEAVRHPTQAGLLGVNALITQPFNNLVPCAH